MLLLTAAQATAEGGGPLDPSTGEEDWDGDGLTNAEEARLGTKLVNPDTDGDGLPDGWETAHGLYPLDAEDAASDADGDGGSALREYAEGSDPRASDTDGDGLRTRTTRGPRCRRTSAVT